MIINNNNKNDGGMSTIMIRNKISNVLGYYGLPWHAALHYMHRVNHTSAYLSSIPPEILSISFEKK